MGDGRRPVVPRQEPQDMLTTQKTPVILPPPPAGGEQAREVATRLAQAAATSMAHYPDHPLAVASLSRLVGAELGLVEQELEALVLGALLHDVGKLGVPEAVLHKRGPLTRRERWTIESHTVMGARMIRLVWCLRGVEAVIRHHHERYDGNGYPDGLRAEEIPLPARIVAAADAYDAMVGRRVYRSGSRPPTEAIRELMGRAGSQFDARVVAALGRVAVVP